MTRVIDNLEFGRIPRPSIAHNIEKINELVDYVNENDDLIHNQAYQTVTGFNSVSGSNALADMQARDFLIKGNTIVWNQIITDGNFTDISKWIKGSSGVNLSVTDNTATLTIVDNTISSRPNLRPINMYQNPIIGHKYMIWLKAMKNSSVNIAPSIMYGDLIALQTLTENNVWYELKLIKQVQNATYTDATIYISNLITSFSNGDEVKYKDYNIFDLTTAFGAGNEPATVEEFEALFPNDYYPYDAGSMLSVDMDGIEIGNEICEIPASTYFPEGMRGAGTAYDELTSDKAVTRIGSRAYQSGDENDSSVITDGATTYYALPTPTVIIIDLPIETPIIPESQFTATVQKNNVVPVPFELTYCVDANATIDDIIARIEALEQGNRSTLGTASVTLEKQENEPDIIEKDETKEV